MGGHDRADDDTHTEVHYQGLKHPGFSCYRRFMENRSRLAEPQSDLAGTNKDVSRIEGGEAPPELPRHTFRTLMGSVKCYPALASVP